MSKSDILILILSFQVGNCLWFVTQKMRKEPISEMWMKFTFITLIN